MRRRGLRLRGFDYTQAGLYFVTACVDKQRCVLGTVVDDCVLLSRVGVVADECLLSTVDHHSDVGVDAYVVMPNHVHVVLALGDQSTVALGVLVGTYKAAVSRLSGTIGLWQRGYYDHVIRDEDDLARVRENIETNPTRWASDPENPGRRM
jgi:putative transposase